MFVWHTESLALVHGRVFSTGFTDTLVNFFMPAMIEGTTDHFSLSPLLVAWFWMGSSNINRYQQKAQSIWLCVFVCVCVCFVCVLG